MHRLTDLASVCRGTGFQVIEVAGWQTRGRGGDGGQYQDGRPTHVMWHHTASPATWDGDKDVGYIATGSSVAPLSNLYISRKGVIYVIAAGPTNTNGSGTDTWGGGVAPNDMNRHAIGIEMGNDGVGEVWPDPQQNAAVALGVALGRRYKINVGCQRAHFEYAPTRKIDPWGPSRSNRGARTYWDMDAFRGEIFAASNADILGGDMAVIDPHRRWFDTRAWPFGDPLTRNKVHEFPVPADLKGKKALLINITPVGAEITGWVTAFGNNRPDPLTSICNFTPNSANPNTALVPVTNAGTIRFMANQNVHIVVDIQGTS